METSDLGSRTESLKERVSDTSCSDTEKVKTYSRCTGANSVCAEEEEAR